MPLALLVDVEDLAGDLLALLHDLAGVADLAGPAHVADVQQAVDALLDLDEGAVVGQVADHAVDHACPAGTCSATLSHGLGWACFMPREISCFSLLMFRTCTSILSPMLHQLAGVVDPLGPAHLADVDQALDARLRA